MNITREMQNPLFKKGFYAGFSYKLIMDEFDEELHPRDEQGKFTTGEGSNGGGSLYEDRYKSLYDKLSDRDKAVCDRLVKAENKMYDALAHYTMRERGAKTAAYDAAKEMTIAKRELNHENCDNSYDTREAFEAHKDTQRDRAVPFSGEIKDISEQINGCTSTKEVESLLQSQGYFRQYIMSDGSVYDTNKATNLKGMDVESAKSVCRACNKLFNEIPELAGQLNGVVCGNGGGRKYGECMMPVSGCGGVRMNNKFYSDFERVNNMYNHDVSTGFHPAGTNIDAVTFHEFGHAIDNFLTEREGAGRSGHYNQSFSTNVTHRLIAEENSYLPYHTSRYANKNCAECFAENFAEYMNSPNPRPAAVKTGQAVKDRIKQWREDDKNYRERIREIKEESNK